MTKKIILSLSIILVSLIEVAQANSCFYLPWHSYSVDSSAIRIKVIRESATSLDQNSNLKEQTAKLEAEIIANLSRLARSDSDVDEVFGNIIVSLDTLKNYTLKNNPALLRDVILNTMSKNPDIRELSLDSGEMKAQLIEAAESISPTTESSIVISQYGNLVKFS